jgi:hypothetical protein
MCCLIQAAAQTLLKSSVLYSKVDIPPEPPYYQHIEHLEKIMESDKDSSISTALTVIFSIDLYDQPGTDGRVVSNDSL